MIHTGTKDKWCKLYASSSLWMMCRDFYVIMFYFIKKGLKSQNWSHHPWIVQDVQFGHSDIVPMKVQPVFGSLCLQVMLPSAWISCGYPSCGYSSSRALQTPGKLAATFMVSGGFHPPRPSWGSVPDICSATFQEKTGNAWWHPVAGLTCISESLWTQTAYQYTKWVWKQTQQQ